jgi:hypothetical protein
VIYKLISKVLANQLNMVLPHVISNNQSVFIPSMLVFGNIVVVYETLHSMHARLWSKVSYMGIKLDMSKAYDKWSGCSWKLLCVKWSF